MANLGDILAGAAGVPVDRLALNNYVANGQSLAGLRTAQTQQALQGAAQARSEMQASQDYEAKLASAVGPDGKPLVDPANVPLLATMGRMHGMDPQKVAETQALMNNTYNQAVRSNPANLGTPAFTAATAGVDPKFNPSEPMTVPDNFAMNPGVPTPPVQQTPLGMAKTAVQNSTSDLKDAQTAAGGFRPATTAGTTYSDQVKAWDAAQFARQQPADRGRMLAGPLRSLVAHYLDYPDEQPNTDWMNQTPTASVPGLGSHNPINGAVGQAAPGVTLADQAIFNKDMTNGKVATQAGAINTANQHADLLRAIASSKQADGSWLPTRMMNTAWQKFTGSGEPITIDEVNKFLGSEALKTTLTSAGGRADERTLGVGPNSSAQELNNAADAVDSLMSGQLHTLVNRARMNGRSIAPIFNPDVQAKYQNIFQTPTSPAPGQSAAGPPSTGWGKVSVVSQ